MSELSPLSDPVELLIKSLDLFRMGGMIGDKHLLNYFHLHFPHHGKRESMIDVPKGCLAIMVGQGEEEMRVVVPVKYFNHPLFMQLLKEAEEEFGFDQKGTIKIPCHVQQFQQVRGYDSIAKERPTADACESSPQGSDHRKGPNPRGSGHFVEDCRHFLRNTAIFSGILYASIFFMLLF
ncbi:hypothetical protein GIB67_000944 [Kingdonia uniflora]|uniref:Uncharacterized protein n=1 Tax=Kingdonia uniflora TaxID=39325 RepID=A0A7J7MFQ8_9MAGN|nr:hypothetical protein GIB67_000944 [Kingdonia uniflora]